MMNTTASTKMTYIRALDLAIQLLSENHFDGVEDQKALALEKLAMLKTQTEKRNSAESKATVQKRELDSSLQDIVLTVLRNSDKPLTVTEIMNTDTTLGELSNQKVAALIRGLGDKVIKTIDKRKAYFSIA